MGVRDVAVRADGSHQGGIRPAAVPRAGHRCQRVLPYGHMPMLSYPPSTLG